MRLFTAIDIPEEVKDNLRALLTRLRPLAKVSWRPVDNLHITTKFIGEWPEERLDEMKRALAVVGARGEVDIVIRGLGWFPNARHPHVFWAGVAGGERLKSLANATAQAVEAIGIPAEDREFSPHLTLARIKDGVPGGALRQAAEEHISEDFGSFTARAFFLYLSAGGKYQQLDEFELT